MSREIRLPYGEEELSLLLPESNLSGVYLPQPVPACPDPQSEVLEALNSPLDLPPISEIVQPGENIVLLVDDHTRTTPAALILAPLLDRLCEAGVRAEDITIMITHGTHRLSTPEEVRRKVGEEVYRSFRIEQHVCTDVGNQVYLGMTQRGTPVWVNRRVVESDRVIGIGHIGPSPYAGYSGGRKLIVPGVAARDTIDASHSHVPLGFRQFGRADVPCRQDIEQAAALVKMDLLIDVVLSQDERIVRVLSGTPERVFQEGLALARKVYEVPCTEMVDLAITSAYPYDYDLYQAVRAVEYADALVREGGSILLVAACPHGIGGDDFYRLMADRSKQPDDFLRDVVRRNGPVTFSVLGYALARIKAEKKLYIVTHGIGRSELEAMGFIPLASLQEGVDQLLARYGPEARVAVFPSGSSTIPVYYYESSEK